MIALGGAWFITHSFAPAPNFTDAFYHLNAANRLVSGQGFTDPYLWTYIGAPETLPAPSHLYWMPLTSVLAALGMGLFNAPGNYAAAQWPFALLFAGTVYTGFWLGGRLGGARRHAWTAGLLTLFAGYYTRFWGAIDTFAPYALIGALCLLWLGLALTPRPPALTQGKGVKERRFPTRLLYAALAGAFAGLGHLTRADGVLLLAVGWAAVIWPWDRSRGTHFFVFLRRRLLCAIVMTSVYLLVMLPWLARNLTVTGAPLPLGGSQAIWFTEYNDLFNYPPDANAATFFADGLGTLLRTRWEALTGGGLLSGNLGTFVAVEGLVVMTPLMLIGLWLRRHEPLLRGFWLYALGVHLVMTFVFSYPGLRGGLFHSAAALVPWWAALGVVGLDGVVDWMAKKRRHWNAKTAKAIFSTALVAVAVGLSLLTAPYRPAPSSIPVLYSRLQAILPPEARVMVNDPAQLYYYTGLGGVVLPNESPAAIQAIARQYDVAYLLLEGITADGRAGAASPKLWPILTEPQAFLTPMELDVPGVRLYAIHR